MVGADTGATRSVALGGVLLAAEFAPGGGWVAVARRDGDVAAAGHEAARTSFERDGGTA